jgi:methionyl aminopeptidase
VTQSNKLTAMRQGGKILGTILQEVKAKVVVGMQTSEINDLANRLCLKYNVKPSFLGYGGYPASICVSVNDEVVHGIPGSYVVQNGDIVSLDFGVELAGFHTDAAISFGVGNISAEAHRLLTITEGSLLRGIEAAKAGKQVGAIGHEVQKYVESHGFGVVRTLVGHAIGENVHEEPYIPNFGKPGDGPKIRQNTALAIEPMVTTGSHEVVLDEDGWTYKTKDGSLSAHFEHTIWVHSDGPEILTQAK